ncbi:hypothetical protein HY256_02265 [Candidatus Sumerlaeota bacterium]|nr:hypothetical protein [Candidatus Sumerlaeota bacterium]
MQTCKMTAVIPENRKVVLEFPQSVLPGKAELVVQVNEISEVSKGRLKDILRCLEEIDKMPFERRSIEEINRQIAETRESWD